MVKRNSGPSITARVLEDLKQGPKDSLIYRKGIMRLRLNNQCSTEVAAEGDCGTPSVLSYERKIRRSDRFEGLTALEGLKINLHPRP